MTGGSRTIADEPGVVPLEAGAVQPGLFGAKAANLALARAAGMPVIDGFVILPSYVARIVGAPRGERTVEVERLRAAWGSLSCRGRDAVVVRSSSAAEDTQTSSQAGVFESAVDVRGWDDFLDAVRTVAASGDRAGPLAGAAPLAVLVQRHVDPDRSGVLFTTDPVTGRADRMVIAVAVGGPQGLVSGEEAGTRLVVDRRARVVEGPRRRPLRRHHRVALVRLARQAEVLFGGPQDIEWALDGAGHLLLLQSRPITAVSPAAAGPVFGPGPIAETFPDPLRPLEQDLWLPPLREALRVVLVLIGGASHRALDRSPLVIAVDGRPAIDLDLLEGRRARRPRLGLLDPRPPIRRLRVAWQVGRLRSGLPGLIDDLVGALDRELSSVPALDTLDDAGLLALIDRGRASLRAAHGHELLAGTLTAADAATGATVALAALALGRRERLPDAQIVAAHPAVLALVPPAIGASVALPPAPDLLDVAMRAPLGPREALRLRIRWLHELTARAAWTLGERLTASGQIPHPLAVASLDLATLRQVVRSGEAPPAATAPLPSPPLPARFRLGSDGSAVAAYDPHGGAEGVGAGGGRGAGLVEQGHRPSPGSVLVVDTLDPRLAPVLAGLAGLVAATGSPLSHLAILAREHGVATVVGVTDAVRRFPPGSELLVDGSTGEVRLLAPAPVPPGTAP